MLQTLIIRNFVLIDELHIDFSAGFTVITGETGAGKSILLGAIGLLMGQRADSSSVRPGAERCIIEAHFRNIDERAREILGSEDIECEDSDLIVRREISIKGKSRSFVNDTPASLALIKQVSEYLIDIHSQHKNLLLGDAHFQMSVLDLYSGNGSLRSAYLSSYRAYRDAAQRLEALRAARAEALREQDYLQFQFDQLEQACPREGELDSLEEEERQLSHALDIKNGLGKSFAALDDDERGALQALASALEALGGISRYWSGAEELYERMKSVRIELNDLRHSIDSANDEIEYNPDRLAEVTERLDLLNALMQRHGAADIEQLIAIREELNDRLNRLTSTEDEIAELEKTSAEALVRATELGGELSEVRTSAAREVEAALILGLRELGMPHVRLHIAVEPLAQLSVSGADQVTFLFSANKDIKPEPVANIASGGEISRLMLCIKSLIADRRHLPTIIFDEIDTGVSGDIAGRIGSILQQMGASMQVMAVTHLPQIAAAGAQHLYIYKEHAETTRSHIRLLDQRQRIEEIARMQSGSNLTEVSKAAAEQLLEQSQPKAI